MLCDEARQLGVRGEWGPTTLVLAAQGLYGVLAGHSPIKHRTNTGSAWALVHISPIYTSIFTTDCTSCFAMPALSRGIMLLKKLLSSNHYQRTTHSMSPL